MKRTREDAPALVWIRVQVLRRVVGFWGLRLLRCVQVLRRGLISDLVLLAADPQKTSRV